MKAKYKRFISLLRYCRKLEPGMLFDGVSAAVLNAVKSFILLIVSKELIEAVLIRTDFSALLERVLLLLTGHFLFSAVGGFLEKRHAFRFKLFLRKHEMQKAYHLLEIPYAWTEDNDIQQRLAEILNLETKNVFGFQSFTTHINQASGALAGLILAITLAADIFTRKVSLPGLPAWGLDIGFVVIFAMLFSLTLKITAWINGQFGKIIGQGASPLMRYMKAYTTLIYQYRNGKDIRLFGKALVNEYTGAYRMFSEKIFTMMSSLFTKNICIETMMAGLSDGVVYLFIAIKALYGGIKISEILFFIGAFTQMTHFAMHLIDSISMLHAGDLYREKILGYYLLGSDDTSREYVRTDAPAVASPSCKVKGLSFSYPGTEKQVLKNVSFSVAPREKLAIVGENGSGKTTLIKLLLGLYKQYDGDIFLGERNARTMSAEAIHRLFAPVFQDFRLLAFTLKNNVTCFAEASDMQIEETLTRVGMGGFYHTFGPNVYLTRSFESAGVEISGGEAQKIAIARAIMKQADIFILDEPTSALDPIAEREVYEKFNRMTEGKTTVFISHRLSSCKFCDRIIVMKQGEIVQEGTHEELLKDARGQYRVLWDAQSHHYTQ